MGSLLRIPHLLRSMFQVRSILLRPPTILQPSPQVRQKSSQTTGADVAASLCCAQGLFPRGSQVPLNRDGLQQTVDVGSVLYT